MSVLFMGAEMASFTPSDSTVVESIAGSRYDTNFARCAIYCASSANYAEAMPSASATDYWLHFEMDTVFLADSTAATRASLYDSSGNERVRIKYADNTATTLSVDYWNGSAFTSAGSFTLDMSSSRQTIDVRVVCNSASGSINVYVAGTNRLNSGTISTTGITNLKKARFVGATLSSINTGTYVSQVIIADESTVGWRLGTFYPNGVGATTSWTGAYSDIDEVTYSDADFINSSVANQVSTFSQTGPAMTGYTVRAVAVAARAKCGATGPQNIRMALRSAGTDYFSGSDIALTTGYTPVQTVWETNPATSAAWVNTAISALQPGVKSIT